MAAQAGPTLNDAPASTSAHSKAIVNFARDDTFSKFLREDFQPMNYVSRVIKTSSTAPSVEQLERGISDLNLDLRSQVSEKYEELLQQVQTLKELERILQVMTTGVDSLHSSIHRVKSDMVEPFLAIRAKTLQLEHIHGACELLRRVLRFLYLTEKLRSYLQQGSRELPKAAQCLSELDQVSHEADLSGIEVVEAEGPFILKAGEEVVSGASQLLASGLETQNQADVANALQVFYNLNSLPDKLRDTVATLTRAVAVALRAIASVGEPPHDTVAAPAPAPATGRGGPTAGWREALWGRIEKALDTIHSGTVQVWHLQRVLGKMRDPSSHASLLDKVQKPGEEPLTKRFWQGVCELVASQLAEAAKGSRHIEHALVHEYPKLQRMMHELLRRLQSHHEVKQSLSPDEQARLLRGLAAFETSYLGRSQARLFDPVKAVFPDPAPGRPRPPPPGADDVAAILRAIVGELDAASGDGELTAQVSKQAAKALKLVAMRCEEHMAKEPEAFLFLPDAPLPHGQLVNAGLFNALVQVRAAVGSLLLALPPSAADPLAEAVKQVEAVAHQLVVPLFGRIAVIAEDALAQMHREDFGSPHELDPAAAAPCSRYMAGLQRLLGYFHGVILSRYAPSPIIASMVRELAGRLVMYFVHMASLVRPLSEQGKLRLAGDMAQLELALAPLLPVRELGEPYRVLRAFRPFLFRETMRVPQCPELEVLPACVVLHHLFARAPAELQSPHHRAGWNEARYVQWLAEHPPREQLQVIKAALDAYAHRVNQRGDVEFHPVYPVMLEVYNRYLATV